MREFLRRGMIIFLIMGEFTLISCCSNLNTQEAEINIICLKKPTEISGMAGISNRLFVMTKDGRLFEKHWSEKCWKEVD